MRTLSRWRDRVVVSTVAHPGFRVGLDVAGLALLALLATVAVLVASRTGTEADPFVALLAASVVAAILAAAVGARTHRAVVPLAVALWATWFAYDWGMDTVGGPLSGPFGYRNANGSFLAMAVVSWLLAGVALRRVPFIVLGALPAAALSVFAVRNADGAGAVVLAWVALIGSVGRRAARVAIAVCGVALAGVVVTTIVLGATYDPSTGATGLGAAVADAGITERRLALWHDAWTLMLEEPLGIGHDAFRLESPTALSDRDAFRAHHEFLERGAEIGVAGFVLTVLLFAWMFVRLWNVPRLDGVTALGAAAVAVLGVHACVDYVLHTPHVAVMAAALFGTALVPPREENGS